MLTRGYPILGENMKSVSVEGYLAWVAQSRKVREKIGERGSENRNWTIKSLIYHGQKFEFHSSGNK